MLQQNSDCITRAHKNEIQKSTLTDPFEIGLYLYAYMRLESSWRVSSDNTRTLFAQTNTQPTELFVSDQRFYYSRVTDLERSLGVTHDDACRAAGLTVQYCSPLKPPVDLSATRSAAEKGDAEAQYELGAMYEGGQGVPGDDAEAARWYQKSAAHGVGRAQLRLAYLYEMGFGVGQDYVQADTWYTIALSAEKTTTENEIEIRSRDLIEKRMTPDQIAEARKLAQEWKPKK